jgi:hypothetical protein
MPETRARFYAMPLQRPVAALASSRSRCRMSKLPPVVSLLVLSTLLVALLACGSSAPQQLQSATVTPATALASDYPNGMVPFTATGMFDRPPSPKVLNPAVWELQLSSSYPQDAVSFSASGVAQCKVGFSGTVTVEGGAFVCPHTRTGRSLPLSIWNSQADVPVRLTAG